MILEFELEDMFITADDDINQVQVGDLCMDEDFQMFNVGDMKLLHVKMTEGPDTKFYKVLEVKKK